MDKYFTPSIEDIRVGYECEIESSWGWQKGTWPDILDSDTLTGFDKQKKGALQATCAPCLRVPYLTKEQIEAEGWRDEQDRGMSENYGSLMSKNIANEGDYPFKCELQYWHTNKRLKINHPYLGCLFEGECRDINTFRYISKLLGI